MGRQNGQSTTAGQAELPLFAAAPAMVTTWSRIPQPNGDVLMRPGKPVVLEEYIDTREAAKLLGFSQRWVENECSMGRFTTAYQASSKPKGKWLLARSEVMARKSSDTLA